MTLRSLAGALIAGLVAGLLAAVLQAVLLTPLIVESETFESASVLHDHDAEAGLPVHAGHEHIGLVADNHGASAPPLLRGALSAAMALVTYTGFALLLGAGLALRQRAGGAVDARRGLLWGLAGFAAVQLLPALGLPPALPGAAHAALEPRQLWWALTVLASGAGLALLAFGRGPARFGGVALLAAPHLVGAPAVSGAGFAPPELAALFAARSLAVGAAAWAVLGAVAGHFGARAA